MRKRSVLRKLTKPKRSTAIQTLAKQVMTIKRQMKVERPLLNYQYGTRTVPGGSTGDAIIQPYYQFNLSRFTGWQRIFGTTANDDECNSVIWKSFGLDVHIRSFNETDLVNFTMFIVSLRPEASGIYSYINGDLTLNDTFEFINSSGAGGDTASGLVMLNKKLLKIHYAKRFTLGNHGAALSTSSAQTQYGTDRRFYIKMSPNKKIVNPYGDWKANNAFEVSDNYFLLVFSNNASADAENPRIFLNSVHTVQQLA